MPNTHIYTIFHLLCLPWSIMPKSIYLRRLRSNSNCLGTVVKEEKHLSSTLVTHRPKNIYQTSDSADHWDAVLTNGRCSRAGNIGAFPDEAPSQHRPQHCTAASLQCVAECDRPWAPYHTIPYYTIPCHTIQCHIILQHTKPYHAIPYPLDAIPYPTNWAPRTIPYHLEPIHSAARPSSPDSQALLHAHPLNQLGSTQ